MKVCLVVNDLSEVNIDADLVRTGEFALSRVNEKMVQLQNGCICCTLREDLLQEVFKLAQEKRFDYLVIESTGVAEPLPVAETFSFEVPGYEALQEVARLDTMVTVIDTPRFGKDIRAGDKQLADRFEGIVPKEDERTVVDLLIDQCEFANVLILNKVDLCTADEIGFVEAVIKKLNPDAVVHKTNWSQVPMSAVLNTGLFSFEKAMMNQGWLKEVRGTHVPETVEYGISSFVYRRRRPFHPERLWMAIEDDLIKNTLRSKGWFWLATQPNVSGEWSQAGEIFYLNAGGPWFCTIPEAEWPFQGDEETRREIRKDFDDDPAIGDRRQELVFIGIDYDRAQIEAAMDSCLLTDAEMALGQQAWLEFDDPFEPSWMAAAGHGHGEGEGEDECEEDDGDGEAGAAME